MLRTPVRHCELNPIELIWAQIKHEVSVNNTTFKMADVKILTNAALDNVSIENWTKCVKHVIKIENELRRVEGIHDAVDPVIIQLDSSSSDDDTDAYSVSSDSSTDVEAEDM